MLLLQNTNFYNRFNHIEFNHIEFKMKTDENGWNQMKTNENRIDIIII